MEVPRPSLLGGYRPGLRRVVGAIATAYGTRSPLGANQYAPDPWLQTTGAT
jgi:hypothetical protein